jgi:uncharacterized protein (DUF697 family)
MTDAMSHEADTGGSQDGGATAPVDAGGAKALELKADNLIKNHVLGACAASMVPVPLFDVAAITAVQVRMIYKLAEMYDKTFSEHAVRNTIAALVGGTVGHGAGVMAAISLTKAIPGVGWMLGMISLPAVAGGATYAVGRVFARHFQEGGSVSDISVENVRSYYNEQLEKGKKIASTVKQQVHKRTAPSEQPA